MKKPQFAVYRSRCLILNPFTKKDAIFNNKREADLLVQELNRSAGGYYTAPIYTPKRIVKL
jgi:hypothetical protein